MTPAILWAVLLAAGARAEPLFTGLPETLPERFVEEAGFVDFKTMPGEPHAPLGFSFAFNGKPLPPGDQASLKRVFSETFHAAIPRGSRILASRDENGKLGWDYPAGAQAIHLIRWKDALETIFELRLIQKLIDGRWAFGVYTPQTGAPGTLRLRKAEAAERETIPVQLKEGARIDVSFQRLDISSCRRCHFMTHSASRAYPSESAAGPCQVVADNPDSAEWIRRYLQRHGESPVSD